MTLIAAHHLTKHYGERAILDDVSLSIEDRARVGLIGRNGAGKTTLIRVLAEVEDVEDGVIERRRGLQIATVAQAPHLPPDTTVQDALATGLAQHGAVEDALRQLEKRMAAADEATLATLIEDQAALTEHLERIGFNVQHKLEAIADALKIPPRDRTLGGLSLGEQRRVALAIGLLEAPDLLILDEPTNHLDTETIEWLQKTLSAYRGGLLLVTHDRYFLDEVATQMFEIDRGSLTIYEGNYTEYLVRKAERDAIEARSNSRRLRAIEQELTWVRASAPARTTKQKARLKRFDELTNDRPKAAAGEAQFRLPHPPRLGRSILSLENITKAYGDRTLINGLDLELKKKDRIGIIGPNGAGKTTLLKIILGELEPDAGEVVRGVNTNIVYADQARADLDDNNTVLEEVAGDNDKVFVGDTAVQVQSFLEGLLFDGTLQRTKVGALSGGERSRVSLAKSLREAGNLLILDEPTNDLDLATLRVLEEALVEYPGCALVVSHDRYFLERVTTAILAFEGDGRVTLYEGRYSIYLSLRPEPVRAEPEEPKAKPAKRTKIATRRTKRTYVEEQEFASMEDKILEMESDVEARETRLSDPVVIKELGSRIESEIAALERARKSVEELYARWSALSELDAYGR